MAENKLELIIAQSGLEPTKAQVILANFQGYFQMAAEWERRSKDIVVTSADQKVDMQIARSGRLFLRERRIVIEHTRKELKKQALREGKAIDGIANVLKALIVPIEEYLGKQEKFVEIQAAEKAERERIEAERKAEEERIAKEKAEAEAAREEIERKNRIERQKVEAARRKAEVELQARKDAEEKARRDEEERIEALKQASDKEKLLQLANDIRNITLPEVKSKRAKKVVSQASKMLSQVANYIGDGHTKREGEYETRT